MRCPGCGALNPESADWCSQCYADLRPAEETAPPVDDATAARDVTGAPSSPAPEPGGPAGPTPRTEELDTGAGRFRRRDGELEWRCAVCDDWNPLGAGACASCGTPFGRTVAGTPAPELEDVDQGTVVLASGILPGLGHILLGRQAQGITRALFFLFCALGGYLMLRSAAAAGQSVLPAVPLLLGAFTVWGLSIHDVLALTNRRPEMLTPRVLLWLVVGVIGLLLLAFVPGVLSVGGGEAGAAATAALPRR